MAAISKIIIDGFKAFPHEFPLSLEGKNLLMYGENGSGKSSIYYALHSLLQSQCKDKNPIYFDVNNPESIVNQNTKKPNAKVEIVFEGSDVVYSISNEGYKESISQRISPLRDLNGQCVFVNHKFLFNVFSFRNSI
jgi:predicted ATP-dependent endonuclease of OLD family